MGKLMQGSVIVAYPDNVELPEKAGKLTVEEVARLEKARRGIGLTCERTAEALEKNVERLKVPGVDPDALTESAASFEARVTESTARVTLHRPPGPGRVHDARSRCSRSPETAVHDAPI